MYEFYVDMHNLFKRRIDKSMQEVVTDQAIVKGGEKIKAMFVQIATTSLTVIISTATPVALYPVCCYFPPDTCYFVKKNKGGAGMTELKKIPIEVRHNQIRKYQQPNENNRLTPVARIFSRHFARNVHWFIFRNKL
jgi:hypothetical protein